MGGGIPLPRREDFFGEMWVLKLGFGALKIFKLTY